MSRSASKAARTRSRAPQAERVVRLRRAVGVGVPDDLQPDAPPASRGEGVDRHARARRGPAAHPSLPGAGVASPRANNTGESASCRREIVDGAIDRAGRIIAEHAANGRRDARTLDDPLGRSRSVGLQHAVSESQRQAGRRPEDERAPCGGPSPGRAPGTAATPLTHWRRTAGAAPGAMPGHAPADRAGR